LSIRFKLMLTFVLCFGLMAGISLFFLERKLAQGYEVIERRDLSMHMGRVVESLDAELAHLGAFSQDWAIWTEMYRYAQHPDAAWARDNLGAQALQPANLGLAMIYDAKGQLLLMNALDEKGQELTLPHFLASPYVAYFSDPTRPPACSVLTTDVGLMLTCWARIKNSDGTGDAAGTVVMGRFLGPLLISKLRDQIKLPIKLQVNEALPQGLVRWPELITAKFPEEVTFWTSHNTNLYQLYYPLKDLLQQPLGFIALDVARDVHLQGQALFRQVRMQLAAIALLTSCLMALAVHWLLIRRLDSLTSQLAKLASGSRWDARMRMEGRDELGLVSNKVNQLLALIETQVDKLQTLSLTDALTGLPNRRAFEFKLITEYSRAQRKSRPLALLAVDVDHFKRYNDFYGHPAGDVALQVVADILRMSIGRPSDFIARMGGEEFSVLLPETDADGAKEISERIVHNFRMRSLPHADSPVASYMTVSIGIAIAGEETQDSFFSRADQALYHVKHDGRNSYFCDIPK
jgi:diguanylate cyclase (GGDEF)-like protein